MHCTDSGEYEMPLPDCRDMTKCDAISSQLIVAYPSICGRIMEWYIRVYRCR